MNAKGRVATPPWYKTLQKYGQANLRKASWQLINTFIPYFALWYLMIRVVQQGLSLLDYAKPEKGKGTARESENVI